MAAPLLRCKANARIGMKRPLVITDKGVHENR